MEPNIVQTAIKHQARNICPAQACVLLMLVTTGTVKSMISRGRAAENREFSRFDMSLETAQKCGWTCIDNEHSVAQISAQNAVLEFES